MSEALIEIATPSPDKKPSSRRFVKTNITNCVKLEPLGIYYGRCKVNGKLVRLFLETKDAAVAKKKMPHWLIDVRGRVTAKEGFMGSLVEEYERRLNLKVDLREIRERTRYTKVECLHQIQKVWEEYFSTGEVNPSNYTAGGNPAVRT